MTRINWNAAGERFYETGVDRGVLYVDMNAGVPWTGLISVSESPSGGEARPYYQDGQKYANIASKEEFEATITAFTSPKEFAPCDGVGFLQNGLFATQQPRKAFSLSYRTLVGNDIDGQEHGYKIHLVYNALAGPAERSNNTLGGEVELNNLSWQITTLPPSLSGLKPTAHFVIDSRYTPRGLLAAIEDILYGSDAAEARMPLVSELITLFQSEGPLTRTNYITNPSFRKTSGTVEYRRNYAVDPRLVNAGAWTGVDATKGVTQSTAYGPNVTAAVGETWTVSMDVTAPAGSQVTVSMAARPTTAGAFGSNTYSPTAYTIPAGQTVRVSDTHTIQTGADGLRASLGPVSIIDGTVKVDNVLVEKTSAVLPYFDGTTAPTRGLTYSWTGTANASASISTGAKLTDWGGGTGSSWVKTDIPHGNSGYYGQVGGAAVNYNSVIPVAAVGTYWSARVVIAPVPGVTYRPGLDQVRVIIHDGTRYISDGVYVDVPADPTEFFTTANIETAGTAPRLYIYLSGAPVLVAQAIMEQVDGPGIPVGSYFNGSTPDADAYFYSWAGAADASISRVNTWN